MQTGVSRYVGILFCFHIFFSSLLIFIVCKYLLDHAFFLLFSLLPECVAVKYDMRVPPLMSPYPFSYQDVCATPVCRCSSASISIGVRALLA